MEVILIAALSADGFIAREKNEVSTKWTSTEDARWFRQKTTEIGVCIMGRTTFDTIGKPLPGRVILVLSSSGQPIAKAPQISKSQIETDGSVFVTNSTPVEIVTQLADWGVEQVALCGGGTIYHQFLSANLVDHLFLTVEPALFGSGISLSAGPLQTQLQLIQLHPLSENTIVLEYVVKKEAAKE
jgi:dihydrofolate reductase